MQLSSPSVPGEERQRPVIDQIPGLMLQLFPWQARASISASTSLYISAGNKLPRKNRLVIEMGHISKETAILFFFFSFLLYNTATYSFTFRNVKTIISLGPTPL